MNSHDPATSLVACRPPQRRTGQIRGETPVGYTPVVSKQPLSPNHEGQGPRAAYASFCVILYNLQMEEGIVPPPMLPTPDKSP